MNPYTFRGWHLPSAYSDTSNCDRNYPSMYPPTWTSGYFTPPSVYPFQPDGGGMAVKQTNTASDWKLNSINPADSPSMVGSRDTTLMKSGYEGLLYKSAVSAAAVVNGNGNGGLGVGVGGVSGGSGGGLGGVGNLRSDFDSCVSRDDPQRSSCAISCGCNGTTNCTAGGGGGGGAGGGGHPLPHHASHHHHQRLNMLDSSWRSADMSPGLDFKPHPSMSPYQSLCQRGELTKTALMKIAIP
ncbi:homeobox posterior hox 1 [Elysia marginata]|uniref:Homeobox posterior hox 1 n=1 Tax=Elysia marginata TaxID=1093978 RepID=A0AAV4INR9_9GAST|nr:homeobox posterior hox 1 [Elysia marginata]